MFISVRKFNVSLLLNKPDNDFYYLNSKKKLE